MECLPSKSLLALAGVSRHFCASILNILQARLLWLATLDSYTLEVSWNQIDGGNVCFDAEYIDTPGLFHGQGEENLSVAAHLARLPALYSRYKPPRPPIESSSDTAGESDIPADDRSFVFFWSGDEELDLITTALNYIPKNLRSMADIVSLEGDYGEVPFSRDWLNEQADRDSSGTKYPDDGENISWIDGKKNVGFKFRVERKGPGTVEHENTEIATTNYVLTIEGESFEFVSILLWLSYVRFMLT